MPFKKILCAVDFSDQSNAAFRHAVDMAEKSSASLFILHALEVQPLVAQWVAPEGLSDLTMEIEHRAQQAMDSLQDSLGAKLSKLKVKTEITSGRAFTEIIENARVWGADLIVMGGQGAGALEDVPLGSTVDRVLADSSCSVLVVRSN